VVVRSEGAALYPPIPNSGGLSLESCEAMITIHYKEEAARRRLSDQSSGL
jgi:hypothetical protein